MKVLVFGQTGQVARALVLHDRVTTLDRTKADLSDAGALERHIAGTDAEVIINAAAYTAVDQAESESDLAMVINGVAPGVMARAAAARGLPFLHISTDYVFDGSADVPWRANDPTQPQNTYAERGEPIQHCGADLSLGNLAIKVARHETLLPQKI